MVNSYLDLSEPELDPRDQMIETALDDFHSTKECLDGEVAHDLIMDQDMQGAALFLAERAIAGKLCFNDIERARKDYHNYLMDRITQEVDDLIFEREIARAGL
jgi:hypothetical protein